jgi:hypothetical protein
MEIKNLSKGTIALLVVLVIFASVGVYKTAYSIGKSVGKSLNIDNQITEVLKEECDCKEVNQLIYAKGLQYSTGEGFTTEKIEYQLIDCNFTNLEEYSRNINKSLNEKIEGFSEFDKMSLEFVNGNSSREIVIKKGKIQ